MSQAVAPGQSEAGEPPDAALSSKLPADPRSARQARSAVRRALEVWGMTELSGDTELLASELVANAVEHADGKPIGFALRCQADGAGQRAVVCGVSDTSPVLPKACDAGPDYVRGLGARLAFRRGSPGWR